MWKNFGEKLKESFISVLPIAALVLILSLIFVQPNINYIISFIIGTFFLIVGMSVFSLGAEMSMMPMGSSVGAFMAKTKKSKIPFVLIACFIIGFVITIAEPDLLVLAGQLSSGVGVNYYVLIAVAAGAGFFMVIAIIRTLFNIKLSYILLVSYTVLFILAAFTQPSFLPLAFDSGGVTTGPITVPFLVSLGIGLAAVRGEKNNDDSFGMAALCSVGPIIAIIILGLTGQNSMSAPEYPTIEIDSFVKGLSAFGTGIADYSLEVARSLLPIMIVFFIFQIFLLRLPRHQVLRIIIGIVYTFVGLTVFLTGVNVAFLPMGETLGKALGSASYNYILIPIGFVIGFFLVMAEPAVHVLNRQIEEVTGGAVKGKTMMAFLSVAISLAVGLSMVRVLYGINFWYFLLPAYGISLILMFFVPSFFTGIAFDSGGVAAGTMAAAFLLPFAVGVCEAVGGNVFTDAFGIIGMVATFPLLSIQILGLLYKISSKRKEKRAAEYAAEGELYDFDAPPVPEKKSAAKKRSKGLKAFGEMIKEGLIGLNPIKTGKNSAGKKGAGAKKSKTDKSPTKKSKQNSKTNSKTVSAPAEEQKSGLGQDKDADKKEQSFPAETIGAEGVKELPDETPGANVNEADSLKPAAEDKDGSN